MLRDRAVARACEVSVVFWASAHGPVSALLARYARTAKHVSESDKPCFIYGKRPIDTNLHLAKRNWLLDSIVIYNVYFQ